VRYKDYMDVGSKDMLTLAPNLSRQPKESRVEVRFRLVERRQKVRGMTGYPGMGNHTMCVDLQNF
jgi:hypothetical protein